MPDEKNNDIANPMFGVRFVPNNSKPLQTSLDP